MIFGTHEEWGEIVVFNLLKLKNVSVGLLSRKSFSQLDGKNMFTDESLALVWEAFSCEMLAKTEVGAGDVEVLRSGNTCLGWLLHSVKHPFRVLANELGDSALV